MWRCLKWSFMHVGLTTGVLILGVTIGVAQNTGREPAAADEVALVCPLTAMADPATDPKPVASPADAQGTDNHLKSTVDLPEAPSAYVPLSGAQKFNLFLKSTYAPYTFFAAAIGATLAQAEGQWYGYGGGMPGWGKRFGATLADTESRRFIQGFVLSTTLHQDPRYFRSRKNKTIPRAWYAVTRVLVTKSDEGRDTFNTSEFLGALFTSSLQNAYYPERDRGFGNTMNRFLGALSSDASSNLLREFWPDMRRIFRKHAPEKIKEIERKLPSL
jgi:hypothetical protein